MPTITIYLSNELYDKVKNAPSKTVRTALEHYFKESQDGRALPQQPEREPGKNKGTAESE